MKKEKANLELVNEWVGILYQNTDQKAKTIDPLNFLGKTVNFVGLSYIGSRLMFKKKRQYKFKY